MRIELVRLLRMRQVRHPSRFVLWKSKCGSEVRIEITGYPWWLEKPPQVFDRKITFYFEGISDGFLYSDVFAADTFEEDLEPFDVRPLSEHEWAKGAHCDVYCSSPLSDPLDIYVRLHDFLLSVDCPYGPERYLNMGDSGSFVEFAAIASSKAFLICSGPESVCNVACKGLKDSGAAFKIISDREVSSDLICVRCGESYLICQSAYAVFDD